jgi:hypothetical protein
MGSLKQNLATLSDTLPELQGAVEATISESAELAAAVASHVSRLVAREAQAGELGAAVEQVLERLREALAQERASFEEAGPQLATRFAAGEEALGEGAEELAGSAAESASAAERLQSALAEAAGRVGVGGEESAQRLATFGTESAAAGEELESAHEAALAEAEVLRGVVGEVESALAGTVSGLGDRLRAMAMVASSRSADLLARLDQLQGQHDEAVPAAAERLASGQREVLDALRERLEQGVQQLLESAAAAPLEAVTRLGAGGEEVATRCGEGRETVETLLAQLRETMRPVPQAIESVKEAAVKVGLAWG